MILLADTSILIDLEYVGAIGILPRLALTRSISRRFFTYMALSILKEMTGFKRNRLFMFEKYVRLF